MTNIQTDLKHFLCAKDWIEKKRFNSLLFEWLPKWLKAKKLKMIPVSELLLKEAI